MVKDPAQPLDAYRIDGNTIVTHSNFIAEKFCTSNHAVVRIASQYNAARRNRIYFDDEPTETIRFNRQPDNGEEWAELNVDAFIACFRQEPSHSSIYAAYLEILEEFNRAEEFYRRADRGDESSHIADENALDHRGRLANPKRKLREGN